MRNNYREDGFVWFEDQISEMADLHPLHISEETRPQLDRKDRR